MSIEIRYYTKTELAFKIFPNSKDAIQATCRLRYELHKNKDLMNELTKLGYREKQKHLSPVIVSTILNYLFGL